MVKTLGTTVNAMSDLIRWRDSHPILPLLLAASIIILLAVAAAVIWSRGSLLGDELHLVSLRQMQRAYDKVELGRTSEPELAALGFDQTRFRARYLSGLGVQEYFMPRTTAAFDQLDPAIRACFDATDRCSALVFPISSARSGGFMAANAAAGDVGHVVFLMKSGRVAYKAIIGA